MAKKKPPLYAILKPESVVELMRKNWYLDNCHDRLQRALISSEKIDIDSFKSSLEAARANIESMTELFEKALTKAIKTPSYF